MFDKLKDLRELFKANKIKIDGFVFGLHYKPTCGFLVTMSVIVVANWFFAAQINCVFPKSTDNENFIKTANDYCLIHSVYVVHGPYDKEGRSQAHPGVRQLFIQDTVKYHNFYQWVPFMCMVQAIVFYIPRRMEMGNNMFVYFSHIWHWCERKRVKTVKQVFDKVVMTDEEVHKKKQAVVTHIMDYMGHNKFYGYSYLFCEFLNIINVIGQTYLTDVFLGYEFSKYGVEVVNFLQMDPGDRRDPMIRIFPRVGKCTFNLYGPSGSIVPHDGVCVLSSNILYEKIYVCMWCWFALLSVVSVFNVIHITVTIISKYYRSVRIRCHSPFTNFRKIRFLCKEIQIGDWLFISLIGKNIDPLIYRDIIEDVIVELETKKNIRRNRSDRYRNRPTENDFDTTYNEISAVAVNVNRNRITRTCYEESRIGAT